MYLSYHNNLRTETHEWRLRGGSSGGFRVRTRMTSRACMVGNHRSHSRRNRRLETCRVQSRTAERSCFRVVWRSFWCRLFEEAVTAQKCEEPKGVLKPDQVFCQVFARYYFWYVLVAINQRWDVHISTQDALHTGFCCEGCARRQGTNTSLVGFPVGQSN